jgi:hypothetical protein
VNKIIKRLDSVHQKLLDTVLAVDPERFKQRPTENEWSVAEIIHHLQLVEERVISEVEKGLAGPPQKAGLLARFIPPSIAASRLLRVKAPKAVVPTSSPEKQAAIDNFEATRKRLKELCAKAGPQRLGQIVLKHPFFGRIDGTAAVSFVSYHELRHYKQIREVLGTG